MRSGRGSRPRTKTRPEHADAEAAMVVTVDRGRWGCALGGDPDRAVTAMRARELGRTPIVVGDDVDIVGDLSGTARHPGPHRPPRSERRTVLRRTADDTDPTERVVVANADQLLIVVALADPPPRTGFVERSLIAAYAGGLTPILCLTKSDLAPPEPFAAQFAGLDLTVVTAGRDDDLDAVVDAAGGQVTVLVGHSGVGKSTMVNRLVPDADRAVGVVSGVGKGKHTSTQSVALPLHGSGWVIDTPGIRSFGLAHIAARRRDAGVLRPGRGDRGLPARLRPHGPARRPRVRAGRADRGRPPTGWSRRAGCWPRMRAVLKLEANFTGVGHRHEATCSLPWLSVIRTKH